MLKRLVLFVMLLALSVSAFATAPDVAQFAKMTTTIVGTSGTTAAFGSNTTTGNAIIAFIRTSSATVSAVSYSVGSQACSAITSDTTQDPHFAAWICENITGGASSTCSVTISGADAYGWLACAEITGTRTSGVIETSIHGTGSGTLDLTVGPITTSTADDLLLYVVGQNALNTYLVGATYTMVDASIVSAGGLEKRLLSGTISGFTSHIDGNGNNAQYTGIVLAIQPPGAGGPAACKNGLLLLGAGC